MHLSQALFWIVRKKGFHMIIWCLMWKPIWITWCRRMPCWRILLCLTLFALSSMFLMLILAGSSSKKLRRAKEPDCQMRNLRSTKARGRSWNTIKTIPLRFLFLLLLQRFRFWQRMHSSFRLLICIPNIISFRIYSKMNLHITWIKHRNTLCGKI